MHANKASTHINKVDHQNSKAVAVPMLHLAKEQSYQRQLMT